MIPQRSLSSVRSPLLSSRNTGVILCLVLTLFWLFRDGAASADPLPDIPQVRPPIIAAVPLTNLTGDEALAWIGIALQEALSWEAQRLTGARVLDLRELVQQAKQLPVALAGLGPDQLALLAGPLGVDVFIGGDYRGGSQQVSVNLFVFDRAKQTQLASRSFSDLLVQVVPRASQALFEMTQSLPLVVPSKGVQPSVRWRILAPRALEARAHGISAMAESLLGGGGEATKRAVGLFRQVVQDDPTDGEAWYRLGEALLRGAEYEEGRQALSRGLGLARATSDRVLELATLILAGESYLRQGRSVEAEPFFAQALPLARQSGDWGRQIAALHGFATVFHLRGETERTKEYLERALECARATANRGAEARLLNHLGELRILLGEHAVARQYLGEAVTLAQTIGDRRVERIGLNDLAVIAMRQGAYREARGALEKALQIARTLGDRRDEALILGNIGDVEALRGAYPAAFPILEEALSLARTVGASSIEVETLRTIGWANFALGAYPEAQVAYEKGLGLARTHKVPLFEGLMLHYLGQVSLARKALDEAKLYEEGALAISQQVASRRVELLALHGLAEVQFARGDYGASRNLFERVMDLAKRLGHSETLWRAGYGLGRIHEVQGDNNAALAQYREAVAIIGSLARQFGEEEERQTFLANKLAAYDALTHLLFKLHQQDSSKGYDREAWAVLEAKKERIAGEALAAARAKPADPQARAEAEEAQAKQDQVLALERSLRNEQAKAPAEQRPAKIQTLTTLLAQTKAEYLAQVKAFVARYPQYKTQYDQHIVDPRSLAKFNEDLPANTLAVQYFAAPDALYLFVVAPGGRFQVKRQPVAQAELYGLIRQYRKYIERGTTRPLTWADDGSEAYRRDVAPLKEVTRKLAAHLLAPIEAELQAYPNLILMPNDLLLYLPIHALTRTKPDGSERFLAETHAVSYLTQQEFASLFKAPPPSATAPLLALANPDGSLPAASREVQELRRIRSGVTTLDGPQATKERFLSLAGQFPDLHLATHGMLDSQRPENSYLLMAGEDEDSQHLGIDEIGGLSLNGGMAVLSACDTALGELVPGAALISLASAFSQARAHAIVASLWEVNDAATRDFMVAFYQALPTAGRAGALQQAQLAVLKNPLTANPHYWAPFILIGAR